MIDYTCGQLMHVLDTTAPTINPDVPVTGVSIDSRTVGRGEVFFGLRGAHTDGALYTEKALEHGAACAVVAGESFRPGWAELNVLAVEDPRKALGAVASDYRARFKGTVIGVTGTSGKTTVKEMLLAVLGTDYPVHGTIGNYNNEIGVPLSLFGLDSRDRFGVFELGMSAAGEIRRLTRMAKPDIGIVLNAGEGHMAFFHSVDEIADAKCELLEELKPGGVAVINGDDARLRAREDRTRARIVRFGFSDGCTVTAGDVDFDAAGCARFTVDGTEIRLGVPGRHMVYNALAVYAAASTAGMTPSAIAGALSTFTAPDKRMEILKLRGVTIVNDTYNANPLSMRAAADVLRNSAPPAGGRRIAVLGDMLELGANSVDEHRAVGRLFAGAGCDLLVAVGECAGAVRKGALGGGMRNDAVSEYPDAGSAGRALVRSIGEGDFLLVKGSRRLGMEKIIGQIREGY